MRLFQTDQEDRYLLAFDFVPQEDGKGCAVSQEMWLWCCERRGDEWIRDAQFDFCAFVSQHFATEFRLRWL
ncbi:MAG: hypothetical protein EOP83_05380 [Verrucomicrobiaceae bacterium]|nr:MAG: hypothetical protein EOP83_05380 [Verrucomicrobiaceae bacterium]